MITETLLAFKIKFKVFQRRLKWIARQRNLPAWTETLRAKFEEFEMKPIDEAWNGLTEPEKEEFLKGEANG